MINKAPKDMNAPEFVAMIDDGGKPTTLSDSERLYTLSFLKAKLAEPAPNPFTEDQLAWMREEQRTGFMFAWSDAKGYIWCSAATPSEKVVETGGWECAGCHGAGMGSFLRGLLSPDDPEPLCFADYAPLPKGADHADD